MPDLSARQLEVVVLVGRDDASWKRVCQVMGVTRYTAREHAKRALKRLGVPQGGRRGLRAAWELVRRS